MNEFNFRAVNAAPRASSGTLGPDSGDTFTLNINSYKIKYINGNKVNGNINVDFNNPSSIPSWLQISHVWSNSEESYIVTFKALSTNDTEATRSFTATFTQQESNNTLSYTITQDVSKTYEFDTNKSNILFRESGGSSTVKVTSRIVPGFTPCDYSVQSVPDWITVSKGDWVDGVQELTLTASRNTTDSQRTATIVLEQLTSQKIINLSVTQATLPDITLILKWPSGTDVGALFLFPESPQQGTTTVAYFSMSILDDTTTHVYKGDVGIRVNKNAAGQTVQALPGQSINCYRWKNGGWDYAGYFVLPESDVTITL